MWDDGRTERQPADVHMGTPVACAGVTGCGVSSGHDRSNNRLRPSKAICLFVNGDLLLAIDGFDPAKRQRRWVPVGGRVEFGELSRDTIVREVEEGLSAEITELELLGVLENVFRFDGPPGHEIVFAYDARFVDSSIYERSEVTGIEGDEEFTAH